MKVMDYYIKICNLNIGDFILKNNQVFSRIKRKPLKIHVSSSIKRFIALEQRERLKKSNCEIIIGILEGNKNVPKNIIYPASTINSSI
jgi:hypothetical protein